MSNPQDEEFIGVKRYNNRPDASAAYTHLDRLIFLHFTFESFSRRSYPDLLTVSTFILR